MAEAQPFTQIAIPEKHLAQGLYGPHNRRPIVPFDHVLALSSSAIPTIEKSGLRFTDAPDDELGKLRAILLRFNPHGPLISITHHPDAPTDPIDPNGILFVRALDKSDHTIDQIAQRLTRDLAITPEQVTWRFLPSST